MGRKSTRIFRGGKCHSHPLCFLTEADRRLPKTHKQALKRVAIVDTFEDANATTFRISQTR